MNIDAPITVSESVGIGEVLSAMAAPSTDEFVQSAVWLQAWPVYMISRSCVCWADIQRGLGATTMFENCAEILK